MKLRNKKTGKIIESECITMFGPSYGSGACRSINEFYTLAELNENWEDYKPKEPLIKDEKIRKAVRAWAEANELSVVRVFYIDETETLKLDSGVNLIAISFESEEDYSHLNRETHTIAELCGEEE